MSEFSSPLSPLTADASSPSPWHVWVDTGGTFTDCLALSPQGELQRVKVLSSGRLRASLCSTNDPNTYSIEASWTAPNGFLVDTHVALVDAPTDRQRVIQHDAENQTITVTHPLPSAGQSGIAEFHFDEEAPVVAARLATGTPFRTDLPHLEMRLATTKGTNALLERKGSKTAFLVTKGFADLLHIGTQQRPHLFDLDIKKPDPLYDRVIEVDERLNAAGECLTPLDLSALDGLPEQLRAAGVKSIAIALLHAYQNPQHEVALKSFLLEAGFEHVSTSHELAPFIKILPRAETTITNAYLAPIMDAYVQRVSHSLHGDPLRLMTSAGGLLPATAFRPKDGLLSGPAGGVVGAAVSAAALQHERVIAFDMGGTSTDVSRYEGSYDYQFEHRVGAARLMAPALKIETVAAGGGSICGFNETGLFVGPESAGAQPGPACYGAGGPLTITDVNLLLGRMDPDHFGIPVSLDQATHALDEVIQRIEASGHPRPDRTQLLNGFLQLANERMADAIRTISLKQGYDPSAYALVAFGGAGGQHACNIADQLGIATLIFPNNAGLLSAHGLRHAREESFAERQVLQGLDECEDTLQDLFTELATQASEHLYAQGAARDQIEVPRRILHLRVAGQEAAEELDYDPAQDLRIAFRKRYQTVFGYDPEDKPIEVVSLHVTAATKAPPIATANPGATSYLATEDKRLSTKVETIDSTAVFIRASLRSGAQIQGPAVIQDDYSTVFVDPGWQAEVYSDETLKLTRIAARETTTTVAQDALVEAELFTHRFEQLVSDMGSQLERTSISTNVKERLDFSCALLDASGELIANAPHIPVHLGALGSCTRTVASQCSLEPKDVIVTNHPAYGGSHLPDVTVINPVFDEAEELIGYVANRAHHAELGGVRPGSMPPDAKNLEEEGVVIPPTKLIANGESRWADIENILKSAKYPTRSLSDNLADLRAQVAANQKGALALQQFCRIFGTKKVKHQMQQLKLRSTAAVSRAIDKLPITERQVTETLDDGTPITLRVRRQDTTLEFDFAGTGSPHPQNFNCNPAIVRSTIIYVMRLLLDQPFPLNEGLLAPIKIHLPTCFLNPPFDSDPAHCPAVVAGNVETSQRVVDTLIKALNLSAGSQGTMNNLIFGNEDFSYYETIAGGAGAGPGFHGADAVHTHMTNTGITDPEILERRYPVRLNQFAIRRGSGGNGNFQGGNGVLRDLEFLRPVQVSLLTQHRIVAPFGGNGGRNGQCGRQTLVHRSGEREELPPTASPSLDAGDRIVIETPGGGGWGNVDSGSE